ncbi:hypothetical protein [Luteimonas sp. R10]|uniref:hypothetical protein n=1 Tax=Luteimonas sp. R10 TaxID=3108176 RepID=UPI00308FAADC|nr:hypothetical protein U3649_03455 [Luteimonas sp. R10]
MMHLAADAGIATLYPLIVKPKWSKDVGLVYLHGNLKIRSRAAVIGKVLDAGALAVAERPAGGAHLDHRQGQPPFKSIPAGSFFGVVRQRPGGAVRGLATGPSGTGGASGLGQNDSAVVGAAVRWWI